MSEAVLCLHDGGRGIGAGHVCRCIRQAGHPLDSVRPHGCECGALWSGFCDGDCHENDDACTACASITVEACGDCLAYAASDQ